MARGNSIVVTADPKGQWEEGYVATSQTFKPGMIVQRDPTVALKAGRHTYKYYDRAADGDKPAGAFWVVTGRLEAMLGKSVDSSSIAAGYHTEFYCPRAGEELNLLLGDVSGTGDAHALGEILMVDDGTGKLVATTGTPATQVAQLLEAVAAPVADTLAWCQWSGY